MLRCRSWTSLLCWIPLGMVALAGCSTRGPPLMELVGPINATLEPAGNTIAAGDVILVRFSDQHKEWSHEVSVDLEGRASFVGLGDAIDVDRLTLAQLRTWLEDQYRKVVKLSEPNLALSFKTTAARTMMMLGEVKKPGPVPTSQGLTLLEGLAAAGGPIKESANLKNLILLRWSERQQKQLAWNFDARLAHWPISGPLLLQAGDVVYVPNTAIDKCNIWVDKYIRRMIPVPYFFNFLQ